MDDRAIFIELLDSAMDDRAISMRSLVRAKVMDDRAISMRTLVRAKVMDDRAISMRTSDSKPSL